MLTLENYDLAVKEFIKGRYEHTVWGEPSVAFENAAKEYGDKVPFPLISVYRSDLGLDTRQNFYAMKTGAIRQVTETKVTRERTIPFNLTYQIDIWATESSVANQLFCELLFRMVDGPSITVSYNDGDSVTKYLLVSEVVDNTDISQASTRGRLARFTIIAQVSAYIMKVVEDDRIFIIPTFYDFKGKLLEEDKNIEKEEN